MENESIKELKKELFKLEFVLDGLNNQYYDYLYDKIKLDEVVAMQLIAEIELYTYKKYDLKRRIENENSRM